MDTSIEFEIDESVLENIEIDALDAMWKTAEALHTDLVLSQTMPRDTGHMQNNATYVETGWNEEYKVVTNTPYAKRLYFHPEYKFQKTENPNAGAYWFEPYISGSKREFIKETFLKFAKGK